MAEGIGRFTRITAQEAQRQLTPTATATPFTAELATLFATMAPFEHYAMVVKAKEKGVVLRERIMRFAQDNNMDGVHVRAGRKKGKRTIIIWREGRQQPPQEPSVQDLPAADISPGAEDEKASTQPDETGKRAAALAPGGPEGESLAPPPPEAGQSIMASDTTPEEEQEERQGHQP
jgi:hypothetical protein